MNTVKEIAQKLKCRKGEAHKITPDGAYWLAVDINIDRTGGDGIGQSSASVTHNYTVRHYRDGSLRAYVEHDAWHQNGSYSGSGMSRTRCDETLECETLEDLVAALCRVAKNADRGFEVYWLDKLLEALPGLVESLPAPDEEPLKA